uniref:Uncharacterized protein n=1 Tax=Apteryx owenii TaxID=8824 RepID=A0A8B9PBF2_APTOW
MHSSVRAPVHLSTHSSVCAPDVDECRRSPRPCTNGRCENSVGSYHCACAPGYRADAAGTDCQDVDECTQQSCAGGRCENTPGSYRCVCPAGYHGAGRSRSPSAADIDECAQSPRPCAPGRCENTPGGYRCACPRGYQPGPDGTQCVDANQAVCWQEVGPDLVCGRPRLDRQVTYTECCCLYGEAWGMDCALCPARDSGAAPRPPPSGAGTGAASHARAMQPCGALGSVGTPRIPWAVGTFCIPMEPQAMQGPPRIPWAVGTPCIPADPWAMQGPPSIPADSRQRGPFASLQPPA